MSLVEVAPATIPIRSKTDPLRVGDVVTVDGVRWKIRAMSRTGATRLQSMNTLHVDIWWTTHVDALPKRGDR